MIIDITCKTDRFNLSVVAPDFINDGCFGEDFSKWLVSALSEVGVDADVICMEDFGWANQQSIKAPPTLSVWPEPPRKFQLVPIMVNGM